jgi:hypothetical protein
MDTVRILHGPSYVRDDQVCGPNCLYIVSRSLGCNVPYSHLLKSIEDVKEQGSSLVELKQLASAMQLNCDIATLSDADIVRLGHAYCIVLIRGGDVDHFIIKTAHSNNEIKIIDPTVIDDPVRITSLGAEGQTCLIISKNEINLPYCSGGDVLALLVAIFAAVFCFSIYKLFKRANIR